MLYLETREQRQKNAFSVFAAWGKNRSSHGATWQDIIELSTFAKVGFLVINSMFAIGTLFYSFTIGILHSQGYGGWKRLVISLMLAAFGIFMSYGAYRLILILRGDYGRD